MASHYQIQLEIAGIAAIFTRPDSGGTPTSYPVPTWSASKAIFESIAFFNDGQAWICPRKVEVCKHKDDDGNGIQFQNYTTNYGGPLRKQNLFRAGLAPGGSSMQLFATILVNVCYRLYADILGDGERTGVNKRHYLKDLFDRRIKRGQCFRTPCLGWSEFTCAYWGPFREGITEVETELNLEIPSMLVGMWNNPLSGAYEPTFAQNVRVNNGTLEYVIPENLLANTKKDVGNA